MRRRAMRAAAESTARSASRDQSRDGRTAAADLIRITSPALPSSKASARIRMDATRSPTCLRAVFAEGRTRWLLDARLRTAAENRASRSSHRRADSQGDRFRLPRVGVIAGRRRGRQPIARQHLGDAPVLQGARKLVAVAARRHTSGTTAGSIARRPASDFVVMGQIRETWPLEAIRRRCSATAIVLSGSSRLPSAAQSWRRP